ncbi:MAG: hypothetical protein Q8P54_02130 [bacterium]|nr:hypothetical protein [bacterium]
MNQLWPLFKVRANQLTRLVPIAPALVSPLLRQEEAAVLGDDSDLPDAETSVKLQLKQSQIVLCVLCVPDSKVTQELDRHLLAEHLNPGCERLLVQIARRADVLLPIHHEPMVAFIRNGDDQSQYIWPMLVFGFQLAEIATLFGDDFLSSEGDGNLGVINLTQRHNASFLVGQLKQLSAITERIYIFYPKITILSTSKKILA